MKHDKLHKRVPSIELLFKIKSNLCKCLTLIFCRGLLCVIYFRDTLPRKTFCFVEAPRMVLFVVFSIIECVLVLMATIISMRLHEAEQTATTNTLSDIQDPDMITLALKNVLDQDGEVLQLGRKINLEEEGAVRSIDDPHSENITTEAFRSQGPSRSGPKTSWNPVDVTGREIRKDNSYFVGTDWRKRRTVRKLSRVMANQKQRKNKGRCGVSAQAVDKFMFLFFFSFSMLFYFTIFTGA